MTCLNAIRPLYERAGRETEVLILDPDVRDVDMLLAAIARPMTVVRLSRDGDPLGQIVTALAGTGPVDRLHILAHGAPGALLIAGTRLAAAAIAAAPERMRLLRGSLAGDAEIALWSCDVAAGAGGNDTLYGGDGLDTLYGGQAGDTPAPPRLGARLRLAPGGVR